LLKRLDKYIIGNYLKTFGFTVLIFTLVSTIINFSEMVHRFIENDVPWSSVVLDYYIWYIPYINSQLVPLYALISVIFFTSRLADNSEILSMLNAGMSLGRIARPYLIGATVIAGLSLFLNHVFVPYGNAQRLAFERNDLGREKDLGRHSEVHMFITPTSKVYVRHYSKKDSTARDVRLETYDGPKLTTILSAARMQWNGKDSTWKLFNRTHRTFDGTDETFMQERRTTIDTTLALVPSDFVAYKYEKDQLSTLGLMQHIKKERARSVGNTTKFEIELAKRTAEPLSVFILTLIGLAIAGRKTRGGMGINLVSGIVLGLNFVFLSRFSHTLANSSAIPTWVGVWIPNMLFSLIALWLLSRAQR
jgi:lipopolysaccharide export system permease protein